MKRILITVFIFNWACQLANAQCMRLDSLYRVLQVVPDEKLKINTLNELAATLGEIGKKGQALFYLKQSLDKARLLHYPAGEADALMLMAGLEETLSDTYQAQLQELQQAEAIYRELGNSLKLAKTLELIGAIHYRHAAPENRKIAKLSYQEALQIRSTYPIGKDWVEDQMSLGALYTYEGEDRKALEAYQKAVDGKKLLGMEYSAQDKLLALYKRNHWLNKTFQESASFQTILLLSIFLGLSFVTSLILWIQRNKAYQLKKVSQVRVPS